MTKADAKYRLLKAGNEKLWLALLQHPEAVAVLVAAGFQPQRQHLAQQQEQQHHHQEHHQHQQQPTIRSEADAEALMRWGAERDRVRIQLEQELSSDTPDPAKIEALMARVEQLSLAIAPADSSVQDVCKQEEEAAEADGEEEEAEAEEAEEVEAEEEEEVAGAAEADEAGAAEEQTGGGGEGGRKG
eukprot:3721214-Rhodomonas_salina.1